METRYYRLDCLISSILVLVSRSSWCSLVLRRLLLHCHLLLLVLFGLDEQLIGLPSLTLEVLVLGQKQLVIDSCFIKEHTSNGWSVLFTVRGMDSLVNVVTDEVVSVITLE